MLKVDYNLRLQQTRASFAEEIEFLNQCVSDSAIKLSEVSEKVIELDSPHSPVRQKDSACLLQLESKLSETKQQLESTQSTLTSTKSSLESLKSINTTLGAELEDFKKKFQFEKTEKEKFQAKLEALELKYQNVSISTMHTKLASLKTQLDLQKLEDAKKLYEKDKKLKKAIQALKSFQNQRRTGVIQLPLDLGNQDSPGIQEPSPSMVSPTQIDEKANGVEEHFQTNSEEEDEDPEEIERNIKRMLEEQERIRKQQQEIVEAAAKEPEPVEDIIYEEKYTVDRKKFERAITKNPHLDNLY